MCMKISLTSLHLKKSLLLVILVKKLYKCITFLFLYWCQKFIIYCFAWEKGLCRADNYLKIVLEKKINSLSISLLGLWYFPIFFLIFSNNIFLYSSSIQTVQFSFVINIYIYIYLVRSIRYWWSVGREKRN